MNLIISESTELSLFFPWEWLPNIFFPMWNFVRSLVSGFDGFHKSPTCSQAPFQFWEKRSWSQSWKNFCVKVICSLFLAAKINLVWILNLGFATSQMILKGQKCHWFPPTFDGLSQILLKEQLFSVKHTRSSICASWKADSRSGMSFNIKLWSLPILIQTGAKHQT